YTHRSYASFTRSTSNLLRWNLVSHSSSDIRLGSCVGKYPATNSFPNSSGLIRSLLFAANRASEGLCEAISLGIGREEGGEFERFSLPIGGENAREFNSSSFAEVIVESP